MRHASTLNVKWFTHDDRQWLHSINFLSERQDLRQDRQGPDTLPDYSGTTAGVVPPEVKEKLRRREKGTSGAFEEDFESENQKSEDPNPCAPTDHSW
jgi:hypothetical protein